MLHPVIAGFSLKVFYAVALLEALSELIPGRLESQPLVYLTKLWNGHQCGYSSWDLLRGQWTDVLILIGIHG